MRVANIYFLVIAGLQQIPGISPTGRWTTLIPLLIVLTFTALKEAYEDVKRHRQDREVNNRHAEVLRDGNFVTIRWKEVMTGDILKVHNKALIPADLVLLKSSEQQGNCYIETANLDGETNLKTRQSLVETHQLDDINVLTGSLIYCEQPNKKLYNFEGYLQHEDAKYPLEPVNVVLRGAALRNTDWIIGVAVYTGHDSKLMRNASKPPRKQTNVERLLNRQIGLMFVLLLLLSAISAAGFGVWQSQNNPDAWYLQLEKNGAASTALSVLTFIILYNNLIPISLYVSVEMVKVAQAYFINNDQQMYHAATDTPALARTSNLNEELGQVHHVFSDKTGTLTCNRMEFKKFSLGGVIYPQTTENDNENDNENDQEIHNGQEDNSLRLTDLRQSDSDMVWADSSLQRHLKGTKEREPSSDRLPQAAVIDLALKLLALCHTVIPEEEDGATAYRANSPDEAALVKAARNLNYVLEGRTPRTLTIRVEGNRQDYDLLHTLEFTNERKRMSVILRSPDRRLLLFCKGADTTVLPLLAPDQPFLQDTTSHLDHFAAEGLRTLTLAYTELDNAVYQSWLKEWEQASNQVGGREDAVAKAAERIEKNLKLLGATAVEDRLQDGVPETIALLGRAGVKVWVLTGDKQETAINIGHSCRLLSQRSRILIANEHSKEDTIRRLKEHREVKDKEAALVIDGHTLGWALEDDVKDTLLAVAEGCRSVICCRVSPSQKAAVVEMVRKGSKGKITLSIGDGANDVPMIQSAHVGVGISGEEGMQAARAADYAIAQFRFLGRLMLVHGRWSYRRTSKVILYSFYKNNLLQFTQFWFSFFNGNSGQTLYEPWTLAAYNVVFTLFPIFLFGIQDKDIDEEEITEYPELYKTGQRRYHFNFVKFWGWIANAIFQAALIFGLTWACAGHEVFHQNGQTLGLWAHGTLTYTCIIVVINFKLAMETRNWTGLLGIGFVASLLVWFVWLLIYSLFGLTGVSFGTIFTMVPYSLLNTAPYWFAIIIIPFICLYRDIVWKYIYRTYWPENYHVIQETRRYTSPIENIFDKKLNRKTESFTMNHLP
eukprot:TRINITY_DN8839_c0_g1_i2.p1 TRINITY_DN8839_c0_g1~~TRINITY_DN8839_c0_g1_i2.p1  ORF type:complete len:1148 (-),score=269.15 TRINITY_DN8839_c0_g1_i2:58-3234(-)